MKPTMIRLHCSPGAYVLDVTGCGPDAEQRGLDYARAMLAARAVRYIRLVASRTEGSDPIVWELFHGTEARVPEGLWLGQPEAHGPEGSWAHRAALDAERTPHDVALTNRAERGERAANPYATQIHRDGTATYWSVYRQVWVRRARTVPDAEIAAWTARERERWFAAPKDLVACPDGLGGMAWQTAR